MINSLSLKKNQFILFRRLLGIASFLIILLSFGLLIFGFVPFKDRSINMISAINNVFEFVNFGKKPFLICLSYIGFSVAYITVAVKLVICIVHFLGILKRWLISSTDDEKTRSATKQIVYYANFSIWTILFLYILSFLLSDFYINPLSLITIVGLIIFSVLINLSHDILFKNNINYGTLRSFNLGLPLSLMIMFAFMCSGVQIIDAFNSLDTIFSNTIKLQTLFQQFVSPMFNFVFLVLLMRISYLTINGMSIENIAKKTLICNIVFVAILLIFWGYNENCATPIEYLELLSKNSFFIISTTLIFIISRNETTNISDTDYFGDFEEKNESDEISEKMIETDHKETRQENQNQQDAPTNYTAEENIS